MLKPYYETKLGKLYCGDCREILPQLEYDVVLTDPVWPNCPADLLEKWKISKPFELFQETINLVLIRQIKRIVVVMRHDQDPRFLTAVPKSMPFFRTVQLPYVMPGFIGRKLGGDEIAYWFGEPVKYGPGRKTIPGRADPAQPGQRPPNGHPCSRALSHFRWLVYWASDEWETICDPFAGSGTTAVACEEHGRPWAAIEISEAYCEIAAKRIEKENQQLKLFD